MKTTVLLIKGDLSDSAQAVWESWCQQNGHLEESDLFNISLIFECLGSEIGSITFGEIIVVADKSGERFEDSELSEALKKFLIGKLGEVKI